MSPTVERITGHTTQEWCKHYSTYMTDNPSNKHVFKSTEEALRTGKKMPPYQVEIFHKDGSRMNLEVNEQPFFEGEDVVGIIGVARDVTKRVSAERERERLNKALQKKNKELESIVYVTSHDLRSPLVNVMGFSHELSKSCQRIGELLKEVSGSSEVHEQLGNILEKEIPESLHSELLKFNESQDNN